MLLHGSLPWALCGIRLAHHLRERAADTALLLAMLYAGRTLYAMAPQITAAVEGGVFLLFALLMAGLFMALAGLLAPFALLPRRTAQLLVALGLVGVLYATGQMRGPTLEKAYFDPAVRKGGVVVLERERQA